MNNPAFDYKMLIMCVFFRRRRMLTFMNKRFPLYSLLALMLTAIVAGCNKDDSSTFVSEGDFGNCSVTSFSIKKNDKVLTGLDSVFFSIDLVDARIFNADSLPKGTDVSKLVLNIGTSSASACELTYRKLGTPRDTTISYIDSPGDSINFSDGPVKLSVTSYNGQNKREYTIDVNVHKVETDTLFWAEGAKTVLPSAISPSAQKTVEFAGKVYCLTADGSSASVAVSENPYYDNRWTVSAAALPVSADIESFTASDAALYILDATGNLFTSTDAVNWRQTGERMTYIYGGYTDRILGARNDADGWKHVTYPASTEAAVPAGCPVSGTSQMITYETKWSSEPLALFVGGRDASGMITGAAWGYDGTSWAKLSNRDIDEREEMTLFPYFTPRVNTSTWRVTERSALIAMGGRYESAEGEVVSKMVYVSYDQGITWDEADSYLQLPDYIPAFSSAQAIVVNDEMSASTARSASGWHNAGGTRLPSFATPVPFAVSRVSVPVTEWECPYIYLFGGVDADGNLHDSLWRGVIRRFTFRPLY